MGTSERRKEIVRILCRRRHETISNLALVFGVSERTIRRDIEILSLTEPIYTQSGRYLGGVYVVDGFYTDKNYLTEDEIFALCKILESIEAKTKTFDPKDVNILKIIILKYKKPMKEENRLY